MEVKKGIATIQAVIWLGIASAAVAGVLWHEITGLQDVSASTNDNVASAQQAIVSLTQDYQNLQQGELTINQNLLKFAEQYGVAGKQINIIIATST